ncbi:Molybdopterin synthase catalytic subunit [Dimargaris verticillata]|uniref:Molybdopterin synthase catalytic subunit n=1 Tax=Dimargaris verticillata TaxID=2761393 RepID=A0A9W8B7Q6_9FUNG|nr:Molybdopterin synthase catalytic subunit [Dimargaris verticillata]
MTLSPLPPQSRNDVLLTADTLDFARVINQTRDPAAGAVGSFLGTTRDVFNGQPVEKLEYEAYVPMATKQLHAIIAEARQQWPLHHVSIAHRLGDCPVGEISVVIAVSSAHRQAALHAVEFLIQRLKETVPIWKKEVLGNGTGAWKENLEALAHRHHTPSSC